MHQNSLFAYCEEKQVLGERAQSILVKLQAWAPNAATDRQITQAMGFSDLNCVRPRLTELIKRGLVEECGNTKCEITGKTVRLVRACK